MVIIDRLHFRILDMALVAVPIDYVCVLRNARIGGIDGVLFFQYDSVPSKIHWGNGGSQIDRIDRIE
jgi:hypothetical protein